MDKASVYIKRIIAFIFCLVSVYYLVNHFPAIIVIPVFLLLFSLLNFRITGKKPDHLFNFKRTEKYFEKGGLRDSLRIFIILIGFLFDIIVWITWGIYLIFYLIIDVYYLLKLITYWVIHAIIWFLRLYVPPVIVLFKSAIHYIFKWPWWIYRLSFLNAKFAYNKPSYFIALRGSIFAFLLVFFFYYLGFLVNIEGLIFIGIILAIIPVSWSFGEIAFMRSRELYKENFKTIKKNFQNGIESVRSILYYLALFIVLFIVQIGLNYLGCIPKAGISLIGIPLNINTFINILILFLFLLIIFGSVIIPSYRLYNDFKETSFSDSLKLFGLIIRKGLQYLFSLIPSSVFSIFILILPVLFMLLTYQLTDGIKDFIIEKKIENIRKEQIQSNSAGEIYFFENQIADLILIQSIPKEIPQHLTHLKNLDNLIKYKEEDINDEQKQLFMIEDEFNITKNQLDEQITEASTYTNRLNQNRLANFQNRKEQLEKELAETKKEKKRIIQQLSIDRDFLVNRKMQIPIIVFFAGLWIVLCAGIILAFLIAYLGNLYYDIFLFRNDKAFSYFTYLIKNEREKDYKQPLLGFTLLIITIIVIIFLYYGSETVIPKLLRASPFPF